MNAALYIRVSSKEQAEHGFSIGSQDVELSKHCYSHNLSIYNTYVDAGISGVSMSNRLALQNLLKDAEAQCFEVVVVWKLNRLARKLVDVLDIVERLEKSNVSVVSITEPFETVSSMGKFILQMTGAVGELERETIRENVKLGLERRSKTGLFTGSIIFGYDVIPKEICLQEGLDSNLRIIQEEAVIVQKIFDMYRTGIGYKAIVNRLNQERVRTKTGKTFSVGIVQKILKNVVYNGQLFRKIEGVVKVVQGTHKPIIELKVWEEVQQRLKRNGHRREKTNYKEYMLVPFLKCPDCGSTMIGSKVTAERKDGSKKIHYYYSCNLYASKGSTECKSNLVPALQIENEVIDFIQRYILQPEIIVDVLAQVNKLSSEQIQLNQTLNALNKREKKLNLNHKLLMYKFENDEISKGKFVSQLTELKKDMVLIEEEKKLVELSLASLAKPKMHKKDVLKVLKQTSKLLRVVNEQERKALIGSLISKITLDNNRQLHQIELKINQSIVALNHTEEEEEKWKIS